MSAQRSRQTTNVPANSPAPRAHRWLLFVHQLPSSPSNLRVRTWRRLQQIGALSVKQALYVLPDTPAAREDFEWLKTEIEGAGGQASVFAADGVDAWSNDALVEEFRRAREASYAALARQAEQLLRHVGRRSKATPRRAAKGPPRRAIQQLKERLAAVEHIDFFGSAGRDRVVTLVRQLEDPGRASQARSTAASRASGAPQYHGRLWVTRPRPGVDRMASAWLIRKFIDREARFGFVADRDAAPRDAVPFDMFGVEFTHRGELCTFETLCDLFRLQDPALSRIAAIVHDLDLKDGRFGAPEAATIGLLIDGLRLTHGDDEVLLVEGISLFESLYRASAEAGRLHGPRAVATRRAARAQRRRPRTRR
jgi:hypothetical protein